MFRLIAIAKSKLRGSHVYITVEAIVTEIKVTSEMTAKSMDETEDMWSHFCLQMK